MFWFSNPCTQKTNRLPARPSTLLSLSKQGHSNGKQGRHLVPLLAQLIRATH